MITNQPHSSIFNIVILLLWLMTDSGCGHHPQSHQHTHNHYHEQRHHHALQSGVDDRGNISTVQRHKKPPFSKEEFRKPIEAAVRALRHPVHRFHTKSSTPRASITSTTEAPHHHRLRHHHDHHRWRQEEMRSPTTTSHARHHIPPLWVDSSSAGDVKKHPRWAQHNKGYSSYSRNHDRNRLRHHDHVDREESHYHTTSIRPVRESSRGNPSDVGRHRSASLLVKSNERSSRMGHGITDKRTHDDDEYHDNEEQVDSLRNTTTPFAGNSQRRRSYSIDDIHAPGYRPGDLTSHKFRTLGTSEGVHHARNEFMITQRRIQAQERAWVMEHISRILQEAECKWPRPKVIPVPNNDTDKTYAPHCTILHRCGDDTGCCGHEGLVCTARNTTSVELYFHVTKLRGPSRTERLTFVNHTQCHCVSRHEFFRVQEPSNLEPYPVQSCQCSQFFEKVILDDGSCRCDCSSDNEDCKSLKAGQEGFSLEDRKCIQDGRCKMPICEFGNYIRRTGRCPRREDKIQWGSSAGNL
ncbi:uncharacterized protein LOC129790797 [Lutzomyia longipalpis]|uniref:uncharacterized protein LOC129790797 n=1 Tax=Lutzomyia longipalpis TaxID=7200 RepID=UPI002483DB77|nr:uncharacterized protein LOC129790797 [Lutzomyia longipalpis]